MCYSTKASLIAWSTSVLIGIYLWQRNRRYDRWNASFIFRLYSCGKPDCGVLMIQTLKIYYSNYYWYPFLCNH